MLHLLCESEATRPEQQLVQVTSAHSASSLNFGKEITQIKPYGAVFKLSQKG